MRRASARWSVPSGGASTERSSSSRPASSPDSGEGRGALANESQRCRRDRSPTSGLNACQLITPAEIGAALGGTWDEGTLRAVLDTVDMCEWEGDVASLGLSRIRVPKGIEEICQLQRAGGAGETSMLGPGFERITPQTDVAVAGAASAWYLADRAIRGITKAEITGQLGVCVTEVETTCSSLRPG
ncbi:MAG TPA: hypothetical protein VNO34_03315 [Actinomycetota bacterium]|nr:hypothetical protein [Actinomycetota bacterium]